MSIAKSQPAEHASLDGGGTREALIFDRQRGAGTRVYERVEVERFE